MWGRSRLDGCRQRRGSRRGGHIEHQENLGQSVCHARVSRVQANDVLESLARDFVATGFHVQNAKLVLFGDGYSELERFLICSSSDAVLVAQQSARPENENQPKEGHPSSHQPGSSLFLSGRSWADINGSCVCSHRRVYSRRLCIVELVFHSGANSNSERVKRKARRYNFSMTQFRFYHPITVRYGDLDPQGHVNNARYLTFMEQARVSYVKHLGLWDGGSFFDFGVIMADAHVTFRAPILWGQPIRVGMRIARLGTKSLDSFYLIEDAETGQVLAEGSSVLVAYDYHTSSTIPIPDEWREIIEAYEGSK
ncbi:MAG: hypothetical protein FJ010_11460 [Chloroflexi bacterium]|nr:hypothetical protein [Chloroflexota bacterium]